MPGKDIEEEIFSKTVPYCIKCPPDNRGIIKPDIVFFKEQLPKEFDQMFEHDKNIVDLVYF